MHDRADAALILVGHASVFDRDGFRHAISTTAALRDPGSPGLAAGVLGISAEVVEQSYNRAGQVQAMTKHATLMQTRLAALKQSADESSIQDPVT
jgi:hypothetical protein